MNCQEEQFLEIEALESIFVDEFELINEQPVTYEIIINADRNEEEDNYIVVKLKVEYPEDYPNVMPKFQFKNLSPVHLNIADFNKCHTMFKDMAEEMLGEQMIFELIENVREFLISKNDVFVEAKLKEIEEQKIKEENMGKKFIAEKKLDYEPVNKDSFSKWLATFTKERDALKAEEMKSRSKEQLERDSRKSGKAYFLEKQVIAGSGINFEDEEDMDVQEEIEEEKDEAEDEDMEKYFDDDVFDDEDIDDVELD
ncbi:unnamed protein product [Moneuplotes crassus]|uniref:RWD domain-containing protein n=1 Tax=Euplotes crassus TaxID=5936 RepID=A0AAD1XS92_EUPCR|nr:unnamed protein product [Moneuplotes crassus]